MLILLVLPLVSSLDSQIINPCGGDNQLIIGCSGDEELSFLGFDLINPNIEIVYPSNDLVIKDVVTGLYGLNVNFSVSDVNLYSCWYRLSGVQTISNTSIPCSNGYNNFLITITNFGDLTLDVFTKDFSNNENSSQVNFSISEYAGKQTGGGSTINPSENVVADFNLYNKTIMCKAVNEFLKLRTNYTQAQRESFKNNLAIVFGFAVSDSVLDEYLENFEENCPEYFEPNEPVEPSEPEEPNEGNKYLGFWIVLGAISLMILCAILFLNSENKKVRNLLLMIKTIGGKSNNPKSIKLSNSIFQRPKKS